MLNEFCLRYAFIARELEGRFKIYFNNYFKQSELSRQSEYCRSVLIVLW